MTNIVNAVFGSRQDVVTRNLWKGDYGQILVISGIDLPEAYEVHFSNDRTAAGTAKTQIGTEDGVVIPDEYLKTGKTIYAWLFLHTGEEDGETVYMATIPVREKPNVSDEQPTPEQQSVITEAIAALQTAVRETTESAAAAAHSETNAASSERNAAASEQNAGTSEINAAGSARDADRSAAAAYQSAERAEQAAQEAGYLDVEIDENGHLIYIRTDAVDVDFSLDEYGHLIMEAV